MQSVATWEQTAPTRDEHMLPKTLEMLVLFQWFVYNILDAGQALGCAQIEVQN